MSSLKTALDTGDDALVIELTDNVKEIAKAAMGSKTRIRSATRIFALNESPEGDFQIAKWTQQKVAKSAMQGLLDVVKEHEQVDRFCILLGECIAEDIPPSVWWWCVQVLLWMRNPKALGIVISSAEATSHGSPGLIGLLARGGELRHEAERVKRYLSRWEGTDKLDQATHDWIYAKLGDENAYSALVERCLNGSMDADNTMRAAQALSHIHEWDLPWGEAGTKIVRAKLRSRSPNMTTFTDASTCVTL